MFVKLGLHLLACALLVASTGCSRDEGIRTFATKIRDGRISQAASAKAHKALFTVPKDEGSSASPRVASTETPAEPSPEETLTKPAPEIVFYTPTPTPEAPPPNP